MIIKMTNNNERKALKDSREKITQSELTSNRQRDRLFERCFYSVGSPTDGAEVSRRPARITFSISWARLGDCCSDVVRDLWHESRKKSFKRDFCHVTLIRSTVNTGFALGRNALRTNVLGERGIVCIAMTKERKSWNHYARHWGVEKCRTR